MLAAVRSAAVANSLDRLISSVAMTPGCSRRTDQYIGRKSDSPSYVRAIKRPWQPSKNQDRTPGPFPDPTARESRRS
jgi:hypothetical protein